jgi:hypothetical protein
MLGCIYTVLLRYWCPHSGRARTMNTSQKDLVHHICRVFAFSENLAADTGTYVKGIIPSHNTIEVYYKTMDDLIKEWFPPDTNVKKVENVNNITSSCLMHHLALSRSVNANSWKLCYDRVTHRLYFPDLEKLEYMQDSEEGSSTLLDIKRARNTVKVDVVDLSQSYSNTLDSDILKSALQNPGLVTCGYFKVLHQPTQSMWSQNSSNHTLWHYLCDRNQAIRGAGQKRLRELLMSEAGDGFTSISLMAHVMLALLFHQ